MGRRGERSGGSGRASRRAAVAGVLLALAAGCSAGGDPVAPPVVRVTGIAAGGGASFATQGHSCAIAGGGLQCWGANGAGQLGDGFLATRSAAPVRVPGLERGVTGVAAGAAHTCAVRDERALCWGMNGLRQLGFESVAVMPLPGPVQGLPGSVTAVAAGTAHSCAVAGGAVFCWGAGEDGRLGAIPEGRCALGFGEQTPCSTAPMRVPGLEGEVHALALGHAHSCAATTAGVLCWGANDRGQLGDGTTTSRAKPAVVSGLPGEARSIAAGASHTCAATATGVFCWGANDAGQLGDGTTEDRPGPTAVRGVEGEVGIVAAGAAQSCAAAEDGVYCWGRDALSPAPDASEGPVLALAVGAGHACAVVDGERVECAGDGAYGQLGDGTTARGPRRARVAAWERRGARDRDGDGRIVVVCLGDSNTEAGFQGGTSWCERLATRLPDARWSVVNRGWAGSTAAPGGSLRPASQPLDYALEHDAPDALILAYGTNDLAARLGADEIALAYQALRIRAREHGVDAWVALTPPARAKLLDFGPVVAELNAKLREIVPPDRVVDFFDGITESEIDGLHLTGPAQDKRADAAREALLGGGD